MVLEIASQMFDKAQVGQVFDVMPGRRVFDKTHTLNGNGGETVLREGSDIKVRFQIMVKSIIRPRGAAI